MAEREWLMGERERLAREWQRLPGEREGLTDRGNGSICVKRSCVMMRSLRNMTFMLPPS